MITIPRLQTDVDFEGRVTFWLPVRGWPVVSLSVLRRADQQTLWHLLNDGLNERGTFTGTLEVHSVTATIARESKETAVDDSGSIGLPVRYAEPPPHMHQRLPEHGEPAALTPDAEYLVTVREQWGSELRRFTLSVPATREPKSSDPHPKN